MLISYKINVSRYGYQERNQVYKHDVSRLSYSLIRVHKQPWDIHIISNDPFRATPNRLASDCSKVHAKYCVSIFNVVICDGAVFNSLTPKSVPAGTKPPRSESYWLAKTQGHKHPHHDGAIFLSSCMVLMDEHTPPLGAYTEGVG